MLFRFALLFTLVAIMTGCQTRSDNARVTLINEGEARCVIVAPAAVMNLSAEQEKDEDAEVVRLRKSVLDLAHYLQKMSGVEVAVTTDELPADDARIPVYIGQAGETVFGPPDSEAKVGQALRIVVDPARGVGLIGQGHLGSSYAIYTLLDRLGCRWYMPSELGEVIPRRSTIALPVGDESLAPYTHYRGIWYADDAYKRRNRLGGFILRAQHALEGYVDKEVLAANPEWRAEHDGKVSKHRLKWSKPGVAEAIAAGIIANLDKNPDQMSVSLSPGDGLGFDDTDDRALDAGDFDPSVGETSITDRQVWLCNKVIEMVNEAYPNRLYGMLAYGLSTRPPVREDVHPQLIPQIAPITYRRAHPMTWDSVPDNEALRFSIKGWAAVCPAISYYFYGWFLAEPASPNPFITKWSEDLRFIYDNGNCRFWQPETLPTFESSGHALYLGLRMAWDPQQDPARIIADFHRDFYAEAADQMAAYWHYIDDGWTSTPEYAGAGFGHLHRWTPAKMERARELLDAGIAAADTPTVKARIAMADKSLALFQQFMDLRHDLADGRFEGIEARAQAYLDRTNELAEAYRDQYAFCWMAYFSRRDVKTWYGAYFNAFYNKTYQDAGRLAAEADIVSAPMRDWRFHVDREGDGEARNWHQPTFDDSGWTVTDTCVDTWSTLGFHGYLGKMWYRRSVQVPAAAEGQRTYLWIGATDGTAKVFVNGSHVPWTKAEGEPQELFSGFCKPSSFDISEAVQAGENQVTILCERTFINELGTGGILGSPVVIYRQ